MITGAAGFIGSHTFVVLLEALHQLFVLDDFINSSPVALERVAELVGFRLLRDQPTLPTALDVSTPVDGDIRERHCLDSLFGAKKFVSQLKR